MQHDPSLFRCNLHVDLALDLCLRGSTPARADALGLRALQMLHRDPALIVCLGTTSDGRAISTDHSNLLRGVDLLGTEGRLLRAFTALATALLLRKEGRNPGVVDEVDGSAEGTQEYEVQEDARYVSAGRPEGYDDNEVTYICGSKMLVGASTMETVSL